MHLLDARCISIFGAVFIRVRAMELKYRPSVKSGKETWDWKDRTPRRFMELQKSLNYKEIEKKGLLLKHILHAIRYHRVEKENRNVKGLSSGNHRSLQS